MEKREKERKEEITERGSIEKEVGEGVRAEEGDRKSQDSKVGSEDKRRKRERG